MNEVIVSGGDALTTAIVEELKNAGATVVRLDHTQVDSETDLADAGIAHALAVVCAGNDEAGNLEIALLARKANPAVRVVARLGNDVLREALREGHGPGAILDVADLAAPSIVKACLADAVHPFEAAGTQFVISGSEAPRDATLGKLFGDLIPVAVVHGENSSTPGEVDACPSRDQSVRAGDWTVLLGTADEVGDHGIKHPKTSPPKSIQRRFRRAVNAVRALVNDLNPAFFPVLAGVLVLTLVSTVVLRLGHRHPQMSWTDALYFTVETVSTTGYGDFSFVTQPAWLRLFAIGMMFGGATIVALLVAFVADLLLSRRFFVTAQRAAVSVLQDHVVVVGLGALGIRVVSDLSAAGYAVAVIERDDENRFLSTARDLNVPIVFGDATMSQTLQAARVDRARAVAMLTGDDMVNIETGIVAAHMLDRQLGPNFRKPEVPLVLRVSDRAMGVALAQRFGFVNTRSTIELAAPWFVGAAIGLQVLDTFSVGQLSFVIGAMRVTSDSDLDGVPLTTFGAPTRVIAITQIDGPAILHPPGDVRLKDGDTIYLVGPYRELLNALGKGQCPPSAEPD
jgi:Trk K+ transport system NAD-binding subunit